MARPACPDCQPGDLTVRGPGDASCSLCDGRFVPLAPAVAAMGVDFARAVPAEPCPTCSAPLASLTVGADVFRACSACAAVWTAPGAVERAAAIAPARPAPAVSAPAPAAPVARAPAGAAPSLAPKAGGASAIRGATRDALARNPGMLDVAVAAPAKPAAAPAAPKPGAARTSAALQRVLDANRGVRLWPFALVAVLLVVGALAFRLWPAAPLDVGGGRTVAGFGAVTRGPVAGIAGAARVRADDHGRRLDVVYLARGARARPVGELVRALFGGGAAHGVPGVVLEVAGEPARIGQLDVWLDGDEAWFVSVSATDNGEFAASERAQALLGSFAPVGRATRAAPSAPVVAPEPVAAQAPPKSPVQND